MSRRLQDMLSLVSLMKRFYAVWLYEEGEDIKLVVYIVDTNVSQISIC